MKSIIDRKAMRRRATTANIGTMGGLLVLLVGATVPLWARAFTDYSVGITMGGFALLNVGLFLANRWVKKPRPEATLDYALRTRNNQHRLYHYLLPHDHVFLTPSGVVVLGTCALDGEFAWKDGKWRRKFSMSHALRMFVEEPLGDPIAEAQAGAQTIAEMISAHVPDPVPVDSMVVFIHPRAEYDINSSPIPVVQPDRLGKRLPQHDPLAPEVWEQVRAALDSAAKVTERKLDDTDE